MALGYSFQPGSEDVPLAEQGQGGPKGLSPQQAVKILSLRVPDRASPSAIAPLALLKSPGGAAAGAAAANPLQDLIKSLMALFEQQGPQQPPAPRVIPGLEGEAPNGPFGAAPHRPIPQDIPPMGPYEELPMSGGDVLDTPGSGPSGGGWKPDWKRSAVTPLF
jgi:hypothetical protein